MTTPKEHTAPVHTNDEGVSYVRAEDVLRSGRRALAGSIAAEGGAPCDVEALARDLHDVAFAWNHTMQPWDGLTDEQRQWFLHRARGILGSEGPHLRRVVRGELSPSMRFTREQAREAVMTVRERAGNS